MSKNKVQLQKGMSLTDFMAYYGDNTLLGVLFSNLAVEGFCCPACGY